MNWNTLCMLIYFLLYNFIYMPTSMPNFHIISALMIYQTVFTTAMLQRKYSGLVLYWKFKASYLYTYLHERREDMVRRSYNMYVSLCT